MASSSLPLLYLAKIKVKNLMFSYKKIAVSIFLLYYIPTGHLEPNGAEYVVFSRVRWTPPLEKGGA